MNDRRWVGEGRRLFLSIGNSICEADRNHAGFHETAPYCQQKSRELFDPLQPRLPYAFLVSRLVLARCKLNSESKPWRCNLSHELEAHSLRRSRQEIRVFTTLLSLQRKLHTILGKGLKISPVVHILCSSTANFRATAITARFLPELPSVFDKPHCRSDESLPQCPRM